MKKLFTNDKFFLAMVVISALLETYYAVEMLIYSKENTYQAIMILLHVLCLVIINITYRKHNKNVMKGMIGALLMALLITSIYDLQNTKANTVLAVILTVLNSALFINHFVINATHHSSPAHITINQIIIALLAIISLINSSLSIVYMQDPVDVASRILLAIGYVCLTCAIVCIESRLDAYRLMREEAGYTEEKGYPKDYDRTKNYSIKDENEK